MKFITFLFIIVLPVKLLSQQYWAPEVSANYANYLQSGPGSLNTAQFHLRAGFDFLDCIYKHNYIDYGIFYQGNGTDYSDNNSGFVFSYRINTLLVTALYQYRIDSVFHNTLFVGGGPYAAINAGSNYEYENQSGTLTNLSLLDAGFELNAMYKTNIGFYLRLFYQRQVNNTSFDTETPIVVQGGLNLPNFSKSEVQAYNFGISAGWYFDNTKKHKNFKNHKKPKTNVEVPAPQAQ